jgi:hypothetical protein
MRGVTRSCHFLWQVLHKYPVCHLPASPPNKWSGAKWWSSTPSSRPQTSQQLSGVPSENTTSTPCRLAMLFDKYLVVLCPHTKHVRGYVILPDANLYSPIPQFKPLHLIHVPFPSFLSGHAASAMLIRSLALLSHHPDALIGLPPCCFAVCCGRCPRAASARAPGRQRAGSCACRGAARRCSGG